MIPNPSPSPVVPFKEKCPIEFSIRNANNEAALYIGDPGETLRVEITNTSSAPITVPVDALGVPKVGMFELRFRPGILAHLEKIKLGQEGWTMVSKTDNEGIALTFKNKQSLTGTKPLTLQPGDSFELTLEHVIVSASGGSRDTNVLLRYQNLVRGTQDYIEGERLQHLSILNHQGAKNIPLHVGFVGSNKVLNDGRSRNTLRLRVANTIKLDPVYPERSVITLLGSQDVAPFKQGAKDDAPSRLILSFVAGDMEKDWALGTDSQVTAIQVNDFGTIGHLLPGSEGGVPNNASGNRQSAQKEAPKLWKTTIRRATVDSNQKDVDIQWKIWAEKLGECFELTMEPIQQAQLKTGEYFELIFSDIITGHPSGTTDLSICYKSIPGYWDGQFVCQIEKSPLINRDDGIGIGTSNPQAKLDVAGTVQAKSFTGDSMNLTGTVQAKSLRVDHLDLTGTVTTKSLSGDGAVPYGVIVMWHGTENDIPEGWKLCNGENGTPDLVDKFIVGAGSANYPAGTSGGETRVTLTEAQMPGHTHAAATNSDGAHHHLLGSIKFNAGVFGDYHIADRSSNNLDITTKGESDSQHNHSVTVNGTGGNEPHENRPPFYALCFIMKVKQ